MTELAAIFREMKFAGVATFIASGNVIFSTKVADSRKLEQRIEAQLKKSLGYDVDTFIRTRAEVAAVAALQPFPKADMEQPAHAVYAIFLKESLGGEQARRLLACRTDVDEFSVDGREFYWLCRIKSNESKVWVSPQMRAVKLPATSTMRNLTTVRKLAALYPVPSGRK